MKTMRQYEWLQALAALLLLAPIAGCPASESEDCVPSEEDCNEILDNEEQSACGDCDPEFCLDGKCVTAGSACPCPTGFDCSPRQQCHPPELVAACGDGDENGAESDEDCGGVCGTCALGQRCKNPSDCLSQNCQAGRCIPGDQPITVAALQESAQWQQVEGLVVDVVSGALGKTIENFSEVLKLSASQRQEVVDIMKAASGAIIDARRLTPSLTLQGDASLPLTVFGELKRGADAAPEYYEFASFQAKVTEELANDPNVANQFSATVFARVGAPPAKALSAQKAVSELRFEPGDIVIARYTPPGKVSGCAMIPQRGEPLHPLAVLSNVTCLYNQHKNDDFRKHIETYLGDIVGPGQPITGYRFGCPEGESASFSCEPKDANFLLTLTPIDSQFASAFSLFDLRHSDLEKFRQGQRQTANGLASILSAPSHPLASGDISAILLYAQGQDTPQTYSYSAVLDALTAFVDAAADDLSAMEGFLSALGAPVRRSSVALGAPQKYYNRFRKKDIGFVPYTDQVRIWYGAGGLRPEQFGQFDRHAWLLAHSVRKTFPGYQMKTNKMRQRFGTQNLDSLIEWMEDPAVQTLYLSAHRTLVDDLLYSDHWLFDPSIDIGPGLACVATWNQYKERYPFYSDTRAIRFSFRPKTANELASCSTNVVLHKLPKPNVAHRKAVLFADISFAESALLPLNEVALILGASSRRGPTSLANEHDLLFFSHFDK